jgi:hypothetical protein
MIRYFFVLLLAGFAVCGGSLALVGINLRNRSRTKGIGYWLRRPLEHISTRREPARVSPAPRLATLLAAAAILGTASYFGLGGSASQASVPPVASATPEPRVDASGPAYTSIHDELRAMMARSVVSDATASAAPPPAPTLAPTPEAPQPAAAPEPVAVAAAALAPTPAAVAAAAPTPTPADGFEALICSKPWPCGEAIAVASCESGRDRNGRLDGNWATNGNNFGLFQINGVHAGLWPDFYTAWMDPVKNTEWAYEIWSASGWRPWSCQP